MTLKVAVEAGNLAWVFDIPRKKNHAAGIEIVNQLPDFRAEASALESYHEEIAYVS